MNYEQGKTILHNYGFTIQELGKDRVLYIMGSATFFNTDWMDGRLVGVADFNTKEPILEEIQFYSDFYITKNGIKASDYITNDWADDEITESKFERKCQNMVKRLKTLFARYKLNRINNDF